MTLAEAVETIRNHCKRTGCEDCLFNRHIVYKPEWPAPWLKDIDEYVCKLNMGSPEDWEFNIAETNIYDKRTVIESATVEILENTTTGETSIGWWKNE